MTPRGTVRVPGDKSISHRALMLAALGEGVSTVRGILQSADVRSTARVLQALGARIEVQGADAVVHGRGIRGLLKPPTELECGNSGTTTRLMAGVVAGHPFSATFVGDASLSARPMRRVAEPLELMGAQFQFGAGDGLPMTITGTSLQSIGFSTRTASAQIKSAILLAALVAQVPVTVSEPRHSRDHTERMLAARGVDLMVDGNTLALGVAKHLPALDVDVPGDPSAAAFFIALAAMSEGGAIDLPDVCLNPTRTGFIRVVQRMGAVVTQHDVREQGGEPVGTVRATGSSTLMGITVGPGDVPSLIDELPMLACLAARATGDTLISGAEELRFKESDRIAAVVANLRAIGVDAEERRDGMRITGSDKPLHGQVDPLGDHRLAMAFGVLGAVPGNDLQILGPECVEVSYPNFWADLARVTT
ncbi:MAG: 3-phosphoshikimate 1-carboxyvinyltransferase [Gemmatimonadaceae bacterium]